MVAKENMKMVKTSPELKKHIKDFFKQGLSVSEVSSKLNVPYHIAYAYSPLNKKRLAKLKKLRPASKYKAVVSSVDAGNVIQNTIDALEAQVLEINKKIKALKAVL